MPTGSGSGCQRRTESLKLSIATPLHLHPHPLRVPTTSHSNQQLPSNRVKSRIHFRKTQVGSGWLAVSWLPAIEIEVDVTPLRHLNATTQEIAIAYTDVGVERDACTQ